MRANPNASQTRAFPCLLIARSSLGKLHYVRKGNIALLNFIGAVALHSSPDSHPAGPPQPLRLVHHRPTFSIGPFVRG